MRLANVDAPQKRAKGGAKATRDLKRLIQGKLVVVDTVVHDAYGRAVAKVTVGRRCVNRIMNRKGAK